MRGYVLQVSGIRIWAVFVINREVRKLLDFGGGARWPQVVNRDCLVYGLGLAGGYTEQRQRGAKDSSYKEVLILCGWRRSPKAQGNHAGRCDRDARAFSWARETILEPFQASVLEEPCPPLSPCMARRCFLRRVFPRRESMAHWRHKVTGREAAIASIARGHGVARCFTMKLMKFASIFLVTISMCLAADIGVIEEIVAKVNGDIVTRGDLDRAIRSVAEELQRQGLTGLRLQEALKEHEKERR